MNAIPAAVLRDPVSIDRRGTPASPGRVSGPARIIRSREDAARLRTGDVAVCGCASPELMALLTTAAGIVTATGGVLSSLVIVARESHVPAVVAVHGATSLIRDGQIIAIDGAAGTVSLRG